MGSSLNIKMAKNIITTMRFSDLFNFRKLWLFWKVRDYTMLGFAKLSNIYELSKLAEKRNIKGAFVECGTYKGGGVAVMAYNSHMAGSKRKIWLFDSFEGLPEPTKDDGKRVMSIYGKNAKDADMCIASVEDVKEIFFRILKLDKKNVEIRKGWFNDTLPKARKEIGDIAILRLDSDWYESEKCCLENLYDNVVKGGFVILDDYNTWAGSKKALDEFLKKRGIKADIIMKKMSVTYFVKP
ncbi:class I SAM-dependent methyltransferase [Candidatus Woesearchaeota archaeon]|nr:class I SAM-dependent methyltransferase [Candidatus Woesearchaeota archaeon]